LKALDQLNFRNRFIRLGEMFYQAKFPARAPGPYLIGFNPGAAALIDLDPGEAQNPGFVQVFCGNRILPDCEPLAMVYSGFQFGIYNPQLGDGRGLLLGEIENGRGETWDLYLKGCGQTRFCRGFDGRATLRSSIREYLAQEALHGLGIPTTRSLSLVGTGELIYRETPEPAAILTRLARTHIRFGSFEYFHYTNRPELVTLLADHVLAAYFPDLQPEGDRYRLLFRRVLERTAALIAAWQAVGFGHGVMNTDNMSILGDTFDFGPFGFMDRFDPRYVCNHSDIHGRYAFHRQPEIGQWNLFKLGETLQHLLSAEVLQEELARYSALFNQTYREILARKLALTVVDTRFEDLMNRLFALLAAHRPDYSNFFRRLAHHRTGGEEALRAEFHQNAEDLAEWLRQYERLLEREDIDAEEQQRRMERANPKFILRNYLAQRAIDLALREQDFSEMERLLHLLRDPFQDQPEVFDRLGIDPELYASDTPAAYLGMQVSCSA